MQLITTTHELKQTIHACILHELTPVQAIATAILEKCNRKNITGAIEIDLDALNVIAHRSPTHDEDQWHPHEFEV